MAHAVLLMLKWLSTHFLDKLSIKVLCDFQTLMEDFKLRAVYRIAQSLCKLRST
jgi:hypothetical protein